VLVFPQLPWGGEREASFATRDVSLTVRTVRPVQPPAPGNGTGTGTGTGTGNGTQFVVAVNLTRPAALTVRVPVSAAAVLGVTVDGAPVAADRWAVTAGFGRSVVEVNCSARGEPAASAVVAVAVDRVLATRPWVSLAVPRGGAVALVAPCPGAVFTRVSDPQGCLDGAATVLRYTLLARSTTFICGGF
jgi:hypothetical protein